MTHTAGSAHIRTRTLRNGERRFDVRYRLGGAGWPLIHGGTYKTLRLAKGRRDFIMGELVAERDPRLAQEWRRSSAPLEDRFREFEKSRLDVSDSTLNLYRNARERLGELASVNPRALTPELVQAWVSDCAATLSPKTIAHYLSTLRQVCDFCDLDPNPARSKKIRLPRDEREEVTIPSCAEWQAMRAQLRPRFLLPCRLMEATGLRVNEALGLRYGDVDFARGFLRISKARTKGRTGGQRWLPVPPELMDAIAATCPLEDRRAEDRVFPFHDADLRKDMALACRNAGIAHYSPHGLRHLRCSLWIHHGFDPVRVKVWSGHANATILLDTYSHIVVDGRADEWGDWWRAQYADERGARVRSWA